MNGPRIMEIVCIVCPNGCRLTAEATANGLIITGNKCPRGEAYAREEAVDPKRVVTAVVRTTSPEWPCVPVKTLKPAPKKAIPQILKSLYALEVSLPVKRGEPVVGNTEGSGVSVVFTRTVPPAEPATPGAPG